MRSFGRAHRIGGAVIENDVQAVGGFIQGELDSAAIVGHAGGVRVSVGDGHARQRRHASRHAAPQPTARPSSFHEQLLVLFRFHILCRFVVVKNFTHRRRPAPATIGHIDGRKRSASHVTQTCDKPPPNGAGARAETQAHWSSRVLSCATGYPASTERIEEVSLSSAVTPFPFPFPISSCSNSFGYP